ncbi:hypothetical protein G7046_g4381 [Stylonectria norvegica]|nr:hypothetical protein G7046_g4381 [Stylonectria norvegica]
MLSAVSSAVSQAVLWGLSRGPQTQLTPHITTTAAQASVTSNAHLQEPQVITMAPVQFEPEFSYGQNAAVVGHLLAATYLTFEVGRSLYRAYRGLGPAQDTRKRLARRHALLPLFSGLALVSFAGALYTAVTYAILSYKVWASQHDVALPVQFYGDKGILPRGENATGIYPFQWLSDTPVHLDAIEIMAEKARRFWWGQQVDLGLASWSLMLAIEGRRRNIPLLWCYQLLGQLVSLSFAQNLFFVALLLTPTPLSPYGDSSLPLATYVRLRNRIFTPKPANWFPHASILLTILTLNFGAIALTPFVANTPSLVYLVLASRILSFTPVILSYIVPAAWGTTYSRHHDAYGTYKLLFRIISGTSFVLHARATLIGIAYNAPDAHYHRHSAYLPFDNEQRSAWERTTTAFGRVLGATADHPVAGGVGKDVILSAISIGCWAAVRATEVSDILASTIPAYNGQGRIEDASGAGPSVTAPGKAKATSTNSDNTAAGPRRRGRPRKVKVDPAEDQEDEDEYEPTPAVAAETEEGDVLPEAALEWESAAVVWGLTALGGLGVGCAGAFGGECVAR